MAAFFIIGERKIRPGLYYRYENVGNPPIAGADDGQCSAVLRSNWGPVGEVVTLENFMDVTRSYGNGGMNGTTAVATEQFRGGARLVRAIRLGIGGTHGSYQILDNEGTAVIQLTLKYPGDRALCATIRPTLDDPDVSELLILEGTTQLERRTFTNIEGQDNVTALITAFNNRGSRFYNLTRIADSTSLIATIDQDPIKGGTNPYDVGGTPGTYQITDNASTPVIQLTMRRINNTPYALTIQPNGDNPSFNDFILSAGGIALQTITYNPATDEIASLISATAAAGTSFFTLTLINNTSNPLAALNNQAITPGTNPTGYSIAAYSSAFEWLEPARWNVMSIDTDDTGVHLLKHMFLNRVFLGGKFCMGVIGEPTTVPFETRLLHASAYNDYQIVYVGNGWVDITGKVYEGWLAAARMAGLIGGTPSNESVTRLAITGGIALTEPLSNNQYERAIQSGMLTFSTSSRDTVWVESGINTLVLPSGTQDIGWKKIKRVKVRFELFQRLNDTIEPLVGRINNDPDGRMTIIQSGNGVCNAMVAERKLLRGARLEEDPANPPEGDSAWFLVFADDIDAFEKGYFNFQFRFAPDNLTA